MFGKCCLWTWWNINIKHDLILPLINFNQTNLVFAVILRMCLYCILYMYLKIKLRVIYSNELRVNQWSRAATFILVFSFYGWFFNCNSSPFHFVFKPYILISIYKSTETFFVSSYFLSSSPSFRIKTKCKSPTVITEIEMKPKDNWMTNENRINSFLNHYHHRIIHVWPMRIELKKKNKTQTMKMDMNDKGNVWGEYKTKHA